MATYLWSSLANGQDVTFNPLVDTLTFDDSAISAAGVVLDLSVPGETTFSYGGKTVTLLAAPEALATTHVTYANGSQLLIGDNTTATASDGAANTLTGTAGDDQLAGLGGNDTLTGGAGNDTYVVRPTAISGASGIVFIQDVVTEGAGAGTDTVYSSSSYALPDNVENLVLTGAPLWRAYTGTGNALDNTILGADGARDRLFGLGGDDVLDGRGGADTLDGGAGADTLNAGADNDVLVHDGADTGIFGGSGTDTLRIDGSAVVLNLAGVAGTTILDVEVVNLTGTGNNTLTLSVTEVLAMSSSTDTLRIDGNAGDVVQGSGSWTQGADTVIGAQTYAQYAQGIALLQVDLDVDRSGVNFAPAGADGTVAADEDVAYAFGAGDFGFTDGNAGDTLAAVRIDALPGAGTLTLSSVAVTAGQVVAVADINAGSLEFTSALNASGTGYAGFTFSVQDSTGVFDASPNILTVDVTAVNDAPVAVDDAQSTAEDTPLVFAAATLAVNDTDVDGPVLTVTAVGNAVNGAVSLLAGNITFTPEADFNGPASFEYTLSDGTLADTGLVAVEVTPVNDAPVNTVPGSQAADFLENLAISGISVADVDIRTDDVAVALSTDLGALSLSQLTGLAFTEGDGSGDSSMAFSGSFSDVNAALNGLVLHAMHAGSGTITLTSSDQDAGSDTDTLTVTVSAAVDLATLTGANGFQISGEAAGDESGRSVSAAGDVNGDGLADLLIGARGRDTNGSSAGASYVVFGQASGFSANLDLSTLTGANGFEINGEAAVDLSGISVSAAGDVNGDGFADLLIGAKGRDTNGSDAGASYVVFGQASGFSANLDLSTLTGANGFEINGEALFDYAGHSVSAAGDVNGDGLGDLIIGAPSAFGFGPGASYVVFAQASGFSANLNLSTLNGADGFQISGEANGDKLGGSVSGAGDVNGDGFDDLIVGADAASPNGGYSGASYVVFGAAGGFASNINLSALTGANGFQITGEAASDQLGWSVSAAGDVNGDGFADLVIGAPYAGPPLQNQAGASYVLFGGDFSNAVTHLGTEISETLTGTAGADVIVAGLGDDTLVGGGGADVFRGGEGDDRIVVSDTAFFDVDGGTGLDTLALDGSGITLDLTLLAESKLTGVEIVDLTGTGNNTLTLDSLEVLNLSDVGNTLRVDGGAGDVLNAGGGWSFDRMVNDGGETYAQFTQGAAVLQVDADVGHGLGFAVALSSLTGANGFQLSGEAAYDRSGVSVSAAGDVNGDGFDDLIVGADLADPNGNYSGASYVVFGQAGGFGANLALSSLTGANGFKISGEAAYDSSGRSVSAAGDVNGDGYADLIVGADYADPNGNYSGASYVVFGQAGGFGANLELSALTGANGFQISGEAAYDSSGRSVSGAGDVNGDGYADLIVGARYADPNGFNSGASYVVFGQAGGFGANLNLSALTGANGFQISGEVAYDSSGFSVSGAGDVNGDGFDDLIVGAFGADPNGNQSGASYVVFGQAGGFGANLDLSSLTGANGFQISGEVAFDFSGVSVSAAGDVNGDGFDDLIVGADLADPNGNQSGASYVVFGRDFRGDVDFAGGAGNDGFTGTAADENIIGGLGNDTLAGGSGADVFRGGEGDDRIVVSDTGFFDVDGGTGSDTLALDGSGITLDLTLLAESKLTGVEIVDLTGSGNNTLALTTLELLNLSDSSNTLRVDGDAGDAVSSTGQGWVAGGTVEVFPTVFYQSYTDGVAVLLLAPDLVAASTIN